MCLYPKFIINRKYTSTIKNGGNVPELKDPRVKWVPVGCGQCIECKKQRSRNWQVRLSEEIRTDKTGKFVTLTFSDQALLEIENALQIEVSDYESENRIATYAIRHFLERWRARKGRSVKHWFVTELGQESTERIHIHGLLFTNLPLDEVREIWGYGTVNRLDKDWSRNYVSERTVNYIVKYVNKPDTTHKYYNPKILTSKGIGSGYLNRTDKDRNRYREKETDERYRTRTDHQLPLPIYYRNKIYTDDEREKLWIERIDKKKRYVIGIETDVSDNEDDYFRLLEQARDKNRRLGYGSGLIDWDRKRYEQNLRNLKRLERIYKNKMTLPPLPRGINAKIKEIIKTQERENAPMTISQTVMQSIKDTWQN